MSPEKWLNDRLRVPERDFNSPMSSGIEPVKPFEDKSSWTKFGIAGQIPAGISPDNLLSERIKRCNWAQLRRKSGSGPEMELLERSKF